MTDDCKGNKLEFNKESYFNRGVYIIVKTIAPLFYRLGITPNMVTTISLYFCYQTIRLLSQKSMWALFYYSIYIVMDYLDGYLARTYNQSTKFGDVYDHTRDVITNLILSYQLIMGSGSFSPLNAALIMILFGLSMASFGYQEHTYNKVCDNNHNGTVDWTTKLCSKDNGCLGWYDELLGTGGIFVGFLVIMFIYLKFEK
jgi:phosphatidylglycerophosphate synthase